jgi:hypothetical protein
MNGPIAKATPTCATCRHKVFRDAKHVICYGAPPTPVPIGGGKNIAGQDVIQFEMIRPQPRASERACAVYQEQDALAFAPAAEPEPEPERPSFAGVDLSGFSRRN